MHQDSIVLRHRQKSLVICDEAIAATPCREYVCALSIREDRRMWCDKKHQRILAADAEIVGDKRHRGVGGYSEREQKVKDQVKEHNTHCLL